MTEEVKEVLAEVPASEQSATAAPVSEEIQETPEQQEAKSEAKTFTQEELDAIVAKRLAREQRKWERVQASKAVQPIAQPSAPVEVPSADKFENPEAYAEALAERKAQEMIARRDFEREQTQVLEAYHEREEEARNKYDDFEQVAYNPKLPITQLMAEAIRSSDIGPEVAYYLGSNPKEADRISRLSPILQAKELGKIEVKLTESPPMKKASSAPAPISPVKPVSGNNSYDTTDPRSVKSMSTSEWIEAERQRQVRKWEAQRNR